MLLESQTADYVDFAPKPRYLLYNSHQIFKYQCFSAKSVKAIQDIKTRV